MHNCKSCSGCGRELSLTFQEIQILHKFSQVPFLPVARRADDEAPVFLDDTDFSQEEYAVLLTLLEKKGLISLDYEIPLKSADLSAYTPYPVIGSMALTARGQQVLELIDLQGIAE